jgi:hypothetical protein
MLLEVIFAQTNDTFDSHAIERHLYRCHQDALVRELYANIGVRRIRSPRPAARSGWSLSV